MEIPKFLIDQISEGRVVIFLGSGSSCTAKNSLGITPPIGNGLSKLLSEKFLGGQYNNAPLNQVGELAISETSLFAVQDYIREIFEGFEPTSAHLTMATIKWFGIVTTNYDLLIEKSYELKTNKTAQKLQKFVEHGDRFEEKMRDHNSVPYLKLHGCITRISNEKCPLILSTDQYITYKKCRERIFGHFYNWASEMPIVFIGHSLQDMDIRTIILDLSSSLETRPRYYMVTPKSDDISNRFFESKKITTIIGTFEEFMDSLDKSISSPFRVLVKRNDNEFPICSKFKINNFTLSEECRQFLESEVDYVKTVVASETLKPTEFYKGYNPLWSAIENNFDAERSIKDKILAEHFLIEEAHVNKVEFILIKGHAGCGKSVLLQRLAWDASKEFDKICLYIKPTGKLRAGPIEELIQLIQEPIYLFIDGIANRTIEISRFVNQIGKSGKFINIIAAERINEWNIACEDIYDLVTCEYEVRYLSKNEIIKLIGLLKKHNSLGELAPLTDEERIKAFEVKAGRQLLVALHEATFGRAFEDIIEDEFNNIQPEEAKELYLTICTLYRLGVDVRAGLISRMHGIGFEDFQKRLFRPLETIIYSKYCTLTRDYVYQARHPHIAQIVFDRAFKDQVEKFDYYLKCFSLLNVDYQSDRKAFREMVHAKTLMNLFSNSELILEIYKIAATIADDEPLLWHQQAIFEMSRDCGNLSKAAEYLKMASGKLRDPHIVTHSLAELELKRYESAKNDLEKETFLTEAEKVSKNLMNNYPWEPFGYHTYLKANIEKLKMHLEKEQPDEILLEKLVKKIEQELNDGLQLFPDNHYLLQSDSELGLLLNDSDRAITSLEKAFEINPKNSLLAIRLHRIYHKSSNLQKAKKVLETALEHNSGEKRLHYAYSIFLFENGELASDHLEYHLKRSFSPGDKNYIAQILYGRTLFVNGRYQECETHFKPLRELRVDRKLRENLRYNLHDIFSGDIYNIQGNYCFIKRDGFRDTIFGHSMNSEYDKWRELAYGKHVRFKIGFTIRGPQAYEISTWD